MVQKGYQAVISLLALTFFSWCLGDETTFMNNCRNFRENNPDVPSVECKTLWNDYNKGDYTTFARRAAYPLSNDKSVFYGGFKDFDTPPPSWVGHGYIAVSDTWSGYIIHNLRECKHMSTCWQKVSTEFARSSRGQIHLFLSEEKDTLYSDESGFAKFELPYLHRLVTEVAAYVMKQDGSGSTKSCRDPSLDNLQNKLREMGKSFLCEDDQKKIRDKFCFRSEPHIETGLCQWLKGDAGELSSSTNVALVITCAVLLLTVIVSCVCKYCRGTN